MYIPGTNRITTFLYCIAVIVRQVSVECNHSVWMLGSYGEGGVLCFLISTACLFCSVLFCSVFSLNPAFVCSVSALSSLQSHLCDPFLHIFLENIHTSLHTKQRGDIKERLSKSRHCSLSSSLLPRMSQKKKTPEKTFIPTALFPLLFSDCLADWPDKHYRQTIPSLPTSYHN